jgi:hypothetical protein
MHANIQALAYERNIDIFDIRHNKHAFFSYLFVEAFVSVGLCHGSNHRSEFMLLAVFHLVVLSLSRFVFHP